ncbi:phosphate acetyltransferase [Treponema paraluiscuniculi Cuniculi A]|uniref:Phosphate acetyltransferase n=2 Tax=Treponema paraluiscuniculi TaxID=53435 RepID=F7XRT8_TREPU|nr:phosphate acetyltransferase [Treponema paraluiscuniculi]AEH40050.1 phosphate acetyltransferase [Treponema paraluiscuniculi Cuniculi A]WKC71983.1 phosphate acetyltransferase [Treponema paraluiscuniculi]
MTFVESMQRRAVLAQKRLVLPEACEQRTLEAARLIVFRNMAAKVFLVGCERDIKNTADRCGIDLTDMVVIDPSVSKHRDQFAERYFQKRKHKGISLAQAAEDMRDPLRFAAMMLDQGHADAMVAGAENTTARVLRAGLTIIGTLPSVKTASSCFVMDTNNPRLGGTRGLFIFSDCAVIPTPTAEQLADIACSAAESCRTFIGEEPTVALLSYSTKGSGGDSDENILRVREAVRILHERRVDFTFDGELQLDAALVPKITEKKAPHSPIMGKVNTLVFPDLSSGNIGYKLVQRLSDADAYGPFLQGFAKPLSDLSRGCSVEDIVAACAVTLVQSNGR